MNYFNLFSTIFITKGVHRILISDLHRDISELYPLELYELIEELKNDSIENILQKYDDDSKEIVQDYLDLLLEKEYGFITKNNWDQNFPPLSKEYDDPSSVSDIFIEIKNIEILQSIRDSIDHLGVKHLVIFSENKLYFEDFLKADQLFTNTGLENIEIFSPFHEGIDHDCIHQLDKNTSRIYSLVFYRSGKIPFKPDQHLRFALEFSRQDLKISACGKVEMKYFNTNLSKVLEAVNHNSCLYKKIGIDANGNIKNCPLMGESFGNIYTHTLENALAQTSFKKYWDLTKDHIEGCKDCEFRYICTDCRAYTERTHQSHDGLDLSKPLKCGYDPYSGIWEEWSRNPLKQHAILSYGLQKVKGSKPVI
ncbi:grasp-with-spasm system SPASM domain peptide maturase [Chryseobacterium sp. G0240]|uniref:grasp-with-spasm system SPASM domain peptide maturase n=1 Tax=Chryseobacterium sp. G0240 TaxID=2487066 RepID=UPI000F44A183|nr:grasp-with-spasm system SPASM domain peptide maturase [Chryseobacterium sp. G0240]ROI01881.1 grasp-with-spasm system SPASM domain peptide maturase [Chryseobacterium sp. G0240]